MIRALAALLPLALVAAGAGSPAGLTSCPDDVGVGLFAHLDAARLKVISFLACRSHTVAPTGAAGPVRWSADGRYLAFGDGRVVPAHGGRVTRPLGQPSGPWAWAPRGHVLAGIVAGGVRLGRRPLLPRGFGAQSLAFDPSGRQLAVSRRREIWSVELRTGMRRLLLRMPSGSRRTPIVTGWAPGGSVLYTLPLLPAISINLDGLPIYAVRSGIRPVRVVPAALAYGEFVARCGSRLTIAAGNDRVTTQRKRLVTVAPPDWAVTELSRDATRSWVSPTCSPNGRWVAASAGRSGPKPGFGLERRSLWLLSLDGRTRRRLTTPPPGRSDELPRWSANGRALLFVRSGPTGSEATAAGTLLLLHLDDGRIESFRSLGRTRNYYGHYGWARQTDWYR